jgi:hypothetical protein
MSVVIYYNRTKRCERRDNSSDDMGYGPSIQLDVLGDEAEYNRDCMHWTSLDEDNLSGVGWGYSDAALSPDSPWKQEIDQLQRR